MFAHEFQVHAAGGEPGEEILSPPLCCHSGVLGYNIAQRISTERLYFPICEEKGRKVNTENSFAVPVIKFSRHVPILRAWTVHFYTSLGLLAGFLALQALMAGKAHEVFIWLGVALAIDATDGPLARRWQVRYWTPAFNGRKLDDITDYINYTLIPVLFAYRFGIVAGAGVPVLGLVLIASAYGFCHEAAKTDDGYFTGFPSYWNIAIFYMTLFRVPPIVAATALAVLAVMVWIPLKYPTWKSKPLRHITLCFSLVWAVSLLALLITFEQAPALLLWGSILFPIYYFALTLYLYVAGVSRRPSKPAY